MKDPPKYQKWQGSKVKVSTVLTITPHLDILSTQTKGYRSLVKVNVTYQECLKSDPRPAPWLPWTSLRDITMKLMGHTRTSNTRHTLNLRCRSQLLCPKTLDYSSIVPGKKSIQKNIISTNCTLTASGPARLPGF